MSVRQTDSAKLKPKNATGRDDDWETALLAALSGKKKHGIEESGNSELELFASVTEGEEMTVTVRKNTRGITVRSIVVLRPRIALADPSYPATARSLSPQM